MEGSIYNENSIEAKQGLETTIVEIKIKTLDSQVYTCRVGKNVSIPDLKEQVALVTGVPSGSQRLICRGKVLKDEHVLSAYDVEDGHTLHLVTRPVPPLSTPATSEGAQSDEQDPFLASHNRPGHISHSVLVGTFNIPDRGGVVFPEINRIFSSVLSTLRVGSAMGSLTNNSNNTLEVPLNVGREDNSDGREHDRITQLRMVTDHLDSRGTGVLTGDVQNQRADLGFLSAIPAVSRVRIVQQVAPDALRTASQYVNRMEQALSGQATLDPDSQPQSSASREQAEHQQSPPARADENPAAWAAIIRRIQDILNNQAGTQLRRFADQLQAESSVQTAAARGSLLSAGVLMERLGLILSEVGGTMRSVRRDSSHSTGGLDSVVSLEAPREPMDRAVFLATDDDPREMDIRIHAGLPPFVTETHRLNGFSLHGQDSMPLSLNMEATRDTEDDRSRGRNVASLGLAQMDALDMQHATSRILASSVPESSQDNPELRSGRGVFYPLLARIQQLNPMLFSRRVESPLEPIEGADHLSSRRGAQQNPNLSVLHSLMEDRLGQVIGIGEDGSTLRTPTSTPPVEPMSECGIGMINSGLRLGDGGVSSEMNDANQVPQGHAQNAVRPLLHALEIPNVVSVSRDRSESSQLHSLNEPAAQVDAEISLHLGSSSPNKMSSTETMELDVGPSGIPSDRFQSGKRMRADLHGEESLGDNMCQRKRTCDHNDEQGFSRELHNETDRMEGVATTSAGTVLQDFLSTLASRRDEINDAGVSLGKCTQEWSLVLQNGGDNTLSLDNRSGFTSHADSGSISLDNSTVAESQCKDSEVCLGTIKGMNRKQDCNDCDRESQLFPEGASETDIQIGVNQHLDNGSLFLRAAQQSPASATISDEREEDFSRHIAKKIHLS